MPFACTGMFYYGTKYKFLLSVYVHTVKPFLSGHSERPKIGFKDRLMLNAGQKYCRMLRGEHSSLLSTIIKLPFVIKIFVLSIFEWPYCSSNHDKNDHFPQYPYVICSNMYVLLWHKVCCNSLISFKRLCTYSKTFHKQPLKKKTKNWFSKLIIA